MSIKVNFGKPISGKPVKIKNELISKFSFDIIKLELFGLFDKHGNKCYKLKRYLGEDLNVEVYSCYEHAISSYRSSINFWMDQIIFNHYNPIS